MTEKELLNKTISLLSETKLLEERYQNQINGFREQICEAQLDRYRLGVIGVTSSGKSTMLNALLGENILSMAVRPSSSQLVTCSKGEERKAIVYFEHKKPEVVCGRSLTASFMKKYSDESRNSKNIERVKQIEFSSPKFAFPEDILLIDSPGLDAFGFDGHEKLTINELLPRIDICIFVTTCTTNSDMKMKQILDEIARYECPLIIVQNKIDSLRESVDGKKSVNEVAREHKRRLERIVNESKITDKGSVEIVQISSKAALDAKTNAKLTAEERNKLYEKSRLDILIKVVNEFFETVRPSVEAARMKKVQNEIERILEEAQTDMRSMDDTSYSPNFEFAGYDKKINQSFDKTEYKLEKALKNFESEFNEKIRYKGSFDNSDIDQLKRLSENCVDEIVSITTQFRQEVEHYCENLNIDARSLKAIGIKSSGSVNLRIHEDIKFEKRKKSGFGNKISRIWGRITRNDDLGYETVKREVYNHEKTKEAIQKYLTDSVKLFGAACDSWEESADKQINNLLAEYKRREKDHEDRKRSLQKQRIKKISTEDFIKKLKNLICAIPKTKCSAKGKAVQTDVKIQMAEVAIPKSSYTLLRLSEQILYWINRRTFEKITDINPKDKSIVIGWDKPSITRFLWYHFNLLISENEMKKGVTQLESVQILFAPEEKLMQTLIPATHIHRNLFLLFDTAQFGSGESALVKSGIIKTLRKSDTLYLIVQNFSEIANGDGISEAITGMFSIKERFNIQCPCRVLVNDKNPIYNLAISELQQGRYETEVEKMQLIQQLRKSIPYHMNPDTEKNISKLIDGYSKAHR